MKSVETTNRGPRNQDFENDVILEGRPISAATSITLTDEVLESAHRYVLFNAAIVEPYLEMHIEELKNSDTSLGLQKNKSLLLKRHTDNFSKWLREKIQVKACTNNELEILQWLANGPRKHAMGYTGYIINGQRFHTKEAEKSTQNSGVSIDATTFSVQHLLIDPCFGLSRAVGSPPGLHSFGVWDLITLKGYPRC
ncbi:uncharacterized protein LOC131317269 [Rhododendron vialii]|uniref:uncharacterized protein LOC131317269 n=1 Tax=Rhododendron vialii TaxID=182163 RepID=UPI00265DAE23|nr:uncharacterized protein LOC131317269 [Rhododendron vialii]